MNQEERDWLEWLKRVQDGVVTQRQAAVKMGVSDRWVRKLLARMKTDGDAVVVHGLRGRSSNRRIDDKTQERVIELLKQPEWHDFGPTFASEQLAKRHEIHVSKETVRGVTSKDSLSETNPTWRDTSSCSVFTRSGRERPQRSRRQTTTRSMSRRLAAANSSSRLSTLAPTSSPSTSSTSKKGEVDGPSLAKRKSEGRQENRPVTEYLKDDAPAEIRRCLDGRAFLFGPEKDELQHPKNPQPHRIPDWRLHLLPHSFQIPYGFGLTSRSSLVQEAPR